MGDVHRNIHSLPQKLAPGARMYRKPDVNQLAFEDFVLPFGGKLRCDNRWVILAKHIPWAEVETAYAQQFSQEELGSPAKSSRLALGALIIKERLGVTDRELVEQIAENPYWQYFLGLMAYQAEAPFHHSLLTTFRKRLTHESVGKMNEALARLIADVQPTEDEPGEAQEEGEAVLPKGQLLVDATCVPADIKYPTDLHLLNEAREKTDMLIDHMHAGRATPLKKPRTYRQKARRDYLRVAKAKKPGREKLRHGIGKQLRSVRRTLRTIAGMAQAGLLITLPPKRYRQLLIINELYRQQLWMYTHRCHRIADRLVSISQPHVRPIVRGKAGPPVEFGAKISVSLVDGVSFVDRISWDAYNESVDLVEQIEAYHRRFGHSPASVHADHIYRTRENRQYCHRKGIRLSGPPLGRPRKIRETNAEQVKRDQQQGRDDATARMAVEGKFGQGKRRFGLGRLMAKRAATSEVMIQVSFLGMNLERLLFRIDSFLVFSWWPNWRSDGNGLLVARGLKMKTDFSDRSGGGLEARGTRFSQLAA
jgi:transposase, IS5 family